LHADRDELGIFYVWKGVIRRFTLAPFPIIGVSGASYKFCGYISLTCADFLELLRAVAAEDLRKVLRDIM